MDELWRRNHVPAFGSWDCNDDLPFTQCFESARQARLVRNDYSGHRDLYVAGDLYANHVVTPAMILVPRRKGKSNQQVLKEEEKKEGWMTYDYGYNYDHELKEPPSPPPPPPRRKQPKPVDEDLYRISPELLFAKSKSKKAWGFFSSCCLLPNCVM